MRVFSILIILLLIPSVLIGCLDIIGQDEGGRLSKEQVLKMDPESDIFEFQGKVFKAGIDWVEEKELTKDEQIGEITEEMANKLPSGAKIYSTKEDANKNILIVVYNGNERRYLFQAGE